MAGHSVPLIVLTILAPTIFIASLIFNSFVNRFDEDMEENDIGNVSDKYYLEITPAGWTFSIWGFIYAWQTLWMLYALVNLFRKTDQGPLYTNPLLLTLVFYCCYIGNLLLNSAWSVVFTEEIIPAAFAFLFLSTSLLIISVILCHKTLRENIDILIKQGRHVDIWLTRLFVHNGLGIYTTWSTIATLLNMGIVMAYRGNGVSQQNASTASLSVLSVIIAAFLIADWFLLDRFTRYTFTPYLVLIVAFIGSIAKNYEEGARNTIITIVLLSVAGAAGLVKCGLTIWRHRNDATQTIVINSNEVKA